MGVNKDEDDDDDDPFACFDSSDDDEPDAGQANDATLPDGIGQQQPPPREEIHRDPENGVLAFHAGTEVALLHSVRTELVGINGNHHDGDNSSGVASTSATTIHKAQTVLDLVDSYCLSRHWMMHVGPEKAEPLRRFIRDCLIEKEKSNDTTRGVHGNVVTFVELGTYCGYSSIFFAKTILEHYRNNGKTATTKIGDSSTAATTASDDGLSFHIYSVEVVEKFAAVATELIRLAGMEAYVTIILMKDPDAILAATRNGNENGEGFSLSSELKRRLPVCNDRTDGASATTIDFLFVDHDKSMYLPNLRELEGAKMIRKGTHVAADNVIFAQIHDYRQYMTDLADKGIVATRLEDSLFVEYCQPELTQLDLGSKITAGERSEIKDENLASNATKDMMRDGIEFSVYLRDPQ